MKRVLTVILYMFSNHKQLDYVEKPKEQITYDSQTKWILSSESVHRYTGLSKSWDSCLLLLSAVSHPRGL